MDIAEILADPKRRLVLTALRDNDLNARDIARILDLPPSAASYQIREMVTAGILVGVRSEKDSRRIFFRLNDSILVRHLQELFSTFFHQPLVRTAENTLLFVCRANSARSQMAAAWARKYLPPAITVASAGIETRPIHRFTLAVMDEVGIDLRTAPVTALRDVTLRPTMVVSVCDSAQSVCGQTFSNSMLLHWSIPDPARRGTIGDFRTARDMLHARVTAFAHRRRWMS